MLSALLLCAQAVLALASPALLGALVHTGVQKQGYRDEVPRVLSGNAYRLFSGMLPAGPAAALARFYQPSDEAPDGTPERYRGAYGCYYLLPEADAAEAADLYRNAVWAAILAARETGRLDEYDFDELMKQVSLTSLTVYAASVSFTEAQIAALYEEAQSAQSALKLQTASLLLPFIYEDAGLDCAGSRDAYVTVKAAELIACAILEFAAAAASSRLIVFLSARTEQELRSLLLRRCLRFSRQEAAFFNTAHLCAVQGSGVTQIGMAIRYGFRLLFYAPVLAVVGSVLTFRKSVPFGLLIVGGAVLTVGTAAVLYALSRRRYYRMQRTYERYAAHIRAVLGQMFTVRSSGAQDSEAARLGAYSGAVRRDEVFVMRTVLTGLSAAGLVVNGLTAFVIAVGMKSMLSSDMNLGDVLTYMQYSVLVVTAFLMLGLTVIFAPRALIALKDIDRILSTEPACSAYDGNTLSPGQVGTVTFEDVKLFPGSPTIRFTARRGTLTLLTGGTGTGKTLLMDALLREFTPAAGRILLDGTEITAFSPAYPTETVVRAGSRPVLYSATVRENLRLHGAQGDDAALLEALAKAECGFLAQRPEDLDRRLENAGEALSGGQRSRLSMAACFARRGDIYIFDDCLTSVDHAMRLRILQRIEALKRDAVVILITQDAEDLPEAEQTVVFRSDRVTVTERGGGSDG